ncbi:MAG: LD-carboxypeptidase [Deltaproteobacteria bacterium]|nr:LD-carboxypeptidase [Deltaproteobacteria bacterium]
MILKPAALKPGDTIAVIAPAGPVAPSELQPGIDLLTGSGFPVVTGDHLYDRQDYLAGSDTDRLEDLHGALRQKSVRAIFCARGGYGIHRLLGGIDYRLFRKNPKILVGYSDITALLLAVQKRTGLVTFHGPMVKDLMKGGKRNLRALLDLISRGLTPTLNLAKAEILNPGREEGKLLGGNLSLIAHLVGTRFMPDLKGAILFVEDRGEPLYRIDRMLAHLKLSGVLKGISALLAGRFEDCGEQERIDRLLLDAVGDLGVPVVSGLPFGHGEKNMPLPVGHLSVLDTGTRTLSFTEPAVVR